MFSVPLSMKREGEKRKRDKRRERQTMMWTADREKTERRSTDRVKLVERDRKERTAK